MAVINVESSFLAVAAHRDGRGNWLPAQYMVEGVVSESLKGNATGRIVFACEGLTFEKGHEYIVFLRRDKSRNSLTCIDPPNLLVEGNRKNRRAIQGVMKDPH